ncbi:hypothetical protein Z951_04535 [Streptomyces sp. PRh5]|uniref:hypothetical protein n=1 Tax=Streptomyces sp. PRh5 TaxID=1158056 RepID=UPI00044588F5|nr:hypothetical protein [Streptomyces sp. PRh5]EXU69472.1 hypothetical protein Z951_04535 [Streptomyces sp. PRh5]
MHDVVIAGGGPVGLFLAGELTLSGCSVLAVGEVLSERDAALGCGDRRGRSRHGRDAGRR